MRRLVDLIRTFIKAYNDTYADKIKAKEIMANLEKSKDIWKQRCDDLLKIEEFLIFNKDIFPKVQ